MALFLLLLGVYRKQKQDINPIIYPHLNQKKSKKDFLLDCTYKLHLKLCSRHRASLLHIIHFSLIERAPIHSSCWLNVPQYWRENSKEQTILCEQVLGDSVEDELPFNCPNQEGQPFVTNSCEVRGKLRGGKSIGSKHKTEFMVERRQTHNTMQQWNPLFQMTCAGHEQFATGLSKGCVHMVKFDCGSLHLCDNWKERMTWSIHT